MDILMLMKERRSIRKYQEKQVPRELVDKIVEAGLYDPNDGGGQRSMIVTLKTAELAKKLGKLNFSTFDRSKLIGGHVSDEQPSVIDDPNIKNGFYDAPTVCVIFGQKDFLFNVADAFCIAENMILAAHALGVDSCIVSRAEETFCPAGRKGVYAGMGRAGHDGGKGICDIRLPCGRLSYGQTPQKVPEYCD